MKKLFPILLAFLLMFSSCIKDELDACAGLLHIYFSYIYGETNQFYTTAKTDVHLNYYYKESGAKYRETVIERASIDIDRPYIREKERDDKDSITLLAWTHDECVEYVDDPTTPMGDGYVHLKEITPGSGICNPVDDLLYGQVSFHAGTHIERKDITIPFVRAVCRVRITMIPQTVQDGDASVNTRHTTYAETVLPHVDDYTFHLLGTRNKIDYNNVTSGEEIILKPKAYYDEKDGNVKTPWFGAFSSLEKYLQVNVYIGEKQVATFDCAPIQLTSTPGDYIDLVIDGHYTRPLMTVKVNGWKLAVVESEM